MAGSRIVLFYLLVFCLLSTYISYLSLRNTFTVKLFKRELDAFLYHSSKTRKNNFLTIDNSIYDDLVVNQTTCKIPNFNPYDAMAVPFANNAKWIEDCQEASYHWTYRDGRALVINTTALHENGLEFEDLNCCYKIVSRVEQSVDNFDLNAENLISYSDCYPITHVSTDFSGPDQVEYIMVECSKARIFSPVAYRGFHAFAQPYPKRSDVIRDKIRYWQNASELPPNILILGTDTTSRLNFRRNMIKSTEVLEGLGAFEMKGYTKSGEHTRHAMCVMLTGYMEEDLQCKISEEGGYDKCPFIWERLAAANYLTAYSEDWPDMYAFGTSGFVRQPVDYYVRTLFNAAHDYGLPFPVNQFVRLSTRWCIGHQTNDEVLLDYTESLLDMAAAEKVPLFAFSWSDTYPHSMDHNVHQLLDKTYADFISNLEQKGVLDNTILFFLSDHGQRYGPFRSTLLGWYEDKLPNMWIRLPKRILDKHPEWRRALEMKSQRLSSPFMFYWTINAILDEYLPGLPPPAEVITTHTKESIPRKYKSQHFLQEIPSSLDCEGVGVPEVFCACSPLKQLSLFEPLLTQAGQQALGHLNAKLPQNCVPLQIRILNGGAMIEKSTKVTYIVGIVTWPGEMQIEANIDYYPDSLKWSNVSEVQRANQINQNHIKCLNGDKTWQLYCYCKQ